MENKEEITPAWRKRCRRYASLLTMAAILVAVGCSTVKPTPEARAAAEARPWAAPLSQAPNDQYPSASLVANLLEAILK